MKEIVDITTRFPERLKLVMAEKKMTQSDLSKVVGVSRQTISLYQNGCARPTTEQLYLMATALNVSSDWLLGMSQFRRVDGNFDAVQVVSEYTGLTKKTVRMLHYIAERGGKYTPLPEALEQMVAMYQYLASFVSPKEEDETAEICS